MKTATKRTVLLAGDPVTVHIPDTIDAQGRPVPAHTRHGTVLRLDADGWPIVRFDGEPASAAECWPARWCRKAGAA